MTTEDALNHHFVAIGIYAEGCTRDDWYRGNHINFTIAGYAVPFPILRRSGPIVVHDLHHLLAECPPSWQGEVELAGWELASGGCGLHLLYWIDRLSLAVIGLLTAPRALWRGLRTGIGRRNLYGSDVEELLRTDVDALRTRVGI